MLYTKWLESVVTEVNKFGEGEETDLVWLRNNLNMLVQHIENEEKFKVQLAQYENQE